MSIELQEYLRVKSDQPRRAKKKKSILKSTIYIDGRTIGFQFNKYSAGTRIAHCKVYTSPDGSLYCKAFGLNLIVKPILHSPYHFEAISQKSC